MATKATSSEVPHRRRCLRRAAWAKKPALSIKCQRVPALATSCVITLIVGGEALWHAGEIHTHRSRRSARWLEIAGPGGSEKNAV